MAIDDNTSYELTGAQVKDLASRINAKEDSVDLAAVAESGSYNDLLDKPTIPAAQVNSDWDAASGVAQILNKPTLSTVATSGSYSDLSNKPTIGNATLTIQKNGTSAGTFTANATSNKTINITVPTTAADVSALPDSTKYGASLTMSINTTDYKVTTTLKDQDGNTLGTAQVIDLPLESVVVNGSYDNTNKKIILTLQNGNTVDIPVGDLIAGLQTEITSSNKLASDLVDDTDQTNKFMTSAEKTKLAGIATGAEVNVQSDWNISDNTSDAFIKNKPTIPTVNNATLTIQKNGSTVKTFTANASSNVTANITVPIVDSSLSDTSTNAIENKAVTTKINEIDRYYRSLVPVGTAITTDGVDLNTVTYLKVGKYYCSSDARVATLLNCPTNKAFMMEVFSPLSTTIDNETTAQWVYRVRILTTYTGLMYIQQVSSGSTAGNFTYGAWSQFAYTSNIDAKPNSYWGTCATAAATAAKVVTVSSSQNFKLVPGAMVTFKAPNTNTAQNPTINVNSTGAKPVWYNSAVVSTGNLNKAGQINRPATYVYDGTNWVWVSWSLDDNTTYSTMSVSEGTTGTATTARTVRADYLKQIIKHYQPTVNDATLTIQKNGTNVQTFTANSATSKTANIQVPNLQTSNTDPGEGSALAADTFLGIYDIAPEDVDGARLVDGSVTAAKIDWSTITAGVINIGSMAAGRQERTVSIPTQANTNYVVLLTLGGAMTGGWTKISLSVASKATSSFTMVNYNEVGYAVNNVVINYLVIPR